MATLMRIVLLFAFMVTAPPSRGAEDALGTQRIKAAFLYKFAAYVEWPPEAFVEADSPLVIGIAGADEMAAELARAITGRKVGTRPMQVRRLAGTERVDACCQILFIGAGNQDARRTELLGQAQGRPVLTVTEAPDVHPRGSVINFLVEDRVRFDIARDAAERNGLQLRSQLLAVARQVSSP
jgi:hypothetical protein